MHTINYRPCQRRLLYFFFSSRSKSLICSGPLLLPLSTYGDGFLHDKEPFEFGGLQSRTDGDLLSSPLSGADSIMACAAEAPPIFSDSGPAFHSPLLSEGVNSRSKMRFGAGEELRVAVGSMSGENAL